MAIIDDFIEKSEIQEIDKQGGNKKCFLFAGYALLLGSFKEEDIEFVKEKQKELVDEGVNVVPIVEYKAISEANDLGYTKGYILQRRAKGEELYGAVKDITKEKYDKRMESLANESQEFYDKTVEDFIKIFDKGLQVDPSKSSNFFYEAGKKINFIDLDRSFDNNRDKGYDYISMTTVLIGGGGYYSFAGQQGSKTQENAANIMQKLKSSFVKNGYDAEKIDKDIEKRYPDTMGKKTGYMSMDITSEYG